MHLTTPQLWVLVALFALAFGGALRTAWLKTPLTPRVVLSFLALVVLALLDFALIRAQQ